MLKNRALQGQVSSFSQSDITCITSHARSLQLTEEPIELNPGIAHVGSVVVCRVASVGAHQKVEDRAGRLVRLYEDNVILGVMGDRYSTTSMFGGVPAEGIDVSGEEAVAVDLLSAGGLIGLCQGCPPYYKEGPTRLQLLGLAAQGGKLLEIRPHLEASTLDISCPLILIAGTSAGVGKTKFASKLIHYLSHELRWRVAATKLAGAGNLDDMLEYKDAGAKDTFDFVDAGLVTTYGVPGEFVVAVTKGVLNHLTEKQPDGIVAEFGGDIGGANVPAILGDQAIRNVASALIVVPSDIMAAKGALTYLKEQKFLGKVYLGQPLKNPAASQQRAWSIIDSQLYDRNLYDCEKIEELKELVRDITRDRAKPEVKAEAESALPFSETEPVAL